MTATPSESPVSIQDFDVYSVGPATPMYAAAPVLANGARLYGVRLAHTLFSFSKPPYVEDLVVVQLSGNLAATVTCDRIYKVEAAPGDVFVLPCQGSFHTSTRVPQQAEGQLIALPPQFIERIAVQDFGGAVRPELRLFLAEQRDPLLYGVGWAVLHCLQSEPRDLLYLDSLLTVLAVHVVRVYSAAGPRELRTARYLPRTVVRRVCDYIEAHLDRDLTLEELGQVANYSPYHLARLFHTATGQTIHHYVTARRLAKAKALLKTTDLPLHQIAGLCGFGDQGQFSRLFHRFYGYPPSSERRI